MVKATRSHPIVKRKPEKILGDSSRVITRLHLPEDPQRVIRIIQRVLDLPDAAAEPVLAQVLFDFADRHKNIHAVFRRHFNKVKEHISADTVVSATKQALIGAYFTMEYSIESAALFNPSIVPHPDQSNLPDDSLRFIMSLRATGEGHLSSIVFRSGVLDADNVIMLDAISDYVETPEVHVDPTYDRHTFQMKLNETGADNDVMQHVLSQLADTFSHYGLRKQVELLHSNPIFPIDRQNKTIEIIFWLANSNYEVSFENHELVSERVIFPTSKIESRGIEDARFVQFFHHDGSPTYYATYTAYNGVRILPQLIETKNFIHFKIPTLNGQAVQNKGLALFPRKIRDRYVMLSRQDGENNQIMFSDNIHFWQESEILQHPTQPWEFIQFGNCGSPLETNEGWIVLTHDVVGELKYRFTDDQILLI